MQSLLLKKYKIKPWEAFFYLYMMKSTLGFRSWHCFIRHRSVILMTVIKIYYTTAVHSTKNYLHVRSALKYTVPTLSYYPNTNINRLYYILQGQTCQ